MTDSNAMRTANPWMSDQRVSGRLVLAGWIGLLSGLTGSINAAPETPAQPVYPEVTAPWLDEVRAQREAWEARRTETREAFEARRRQHNPRSAAYQDAWEEDMRRQRAARLERIERDREFFLDPGPNRWPLLWPVTLSPALSASQQDTTGFTAPKTPLYAPPGWDNLWYFRGY